MMVVDDISDRVLDEGFVGYLESVFPRPRVFYLNQALDVSVEAREGRIKKGFFGHVRGWHPALLWHLDHYGKKTKRG